jgi:cytochrome P450 family 135
VSVEAIQRTEPSLPLGPRLPRLVQMVLIWGHTIPTLRRWHARYGDMFTVREPVGGTVVFLADPEHIRAVFGGRPKGGAEPSHTVGARPKGGAGSVEVFLAGRGNAILAPVLGERSLLVLDGAEHRRRRRLMMPAFHGEQVRRQEAMMREAVGAELDRWPVGRRFAAHRYTRELTLEIILRTVLGVREPERLDRLRRMLPRVVDLGPLLMLMVPFPRLERIGPWRRYWEHKAKVDELLAEEIGRRRRDPNLAERQDVLSTLVRAYDEFGEAAEDGELRDQLITLLLAGHETTATALAWCLELLARNPAAQARLRESVDAGRADYAAAVVSEALRLRPVIANVARVLTEPVVVGGRLLPAGVVVAPSISLVHHDERVHPDARAFRPERWIGEQAAHQGMVLPFGGGPRRCVGAPFAVAELNLAVEEIIRRFRIRPVGARPEGTRVRHITQVPARGARIKLERRH